MNRLIIAGLAAFLCVQSAFAQSTIFFVRHAEKAQGGDEKDPELSEQGHARAESLANALKDAGITSIFATEFKRTQQTAQPLARATQSDVTILPAKETEQLAAKLKASEGNVLVVAHSNTIPEIAKALGASIVFAIDETDYDDLFVLIPGTTTQFLRLHLPIGTRPAGAAGPM